MYSSYIVLEIFRLGTTYRYPVIKCSKKYNIRSIKEHLFLLNPVIAFVIQLKHVKSLYLELDYRLFCTCT